MTRDETRATDAAAVRVFPPAWPLAGLLVGLALQWAWPLRLELPVPVAARYALGALIVVFALVGLGYRSLRTIRVGEQTEHPWKPTFHLVEAGPFRFTRNPMYVQMILVQLGFAVALANPWIGALLPVTALGLHYTAILPEEAYLLAKFGEDYADYQRRVPRWL